MKIHSFQSVLMEGYMEEKERKNGSNQVLKISLNSLSVNINMNVSLIAPICACIFRGMLYMSIVIRYVLRSFIVQGGITWLSLKGK